MLCYRKFTFIKFSKKILSVVVHDFTSLVEVDINCVENILKTESL